MCHQKVSERMQPRSQAVTLMAESEEELKSLLMKVKVESVAPDPAESRGAPPPPQDPSPLRGTLGSSLRSPAEGEVSREGRDLGVAFQAPPGSQASSRGEAKDSALLSSRDAGSSISYQL